MLLNVKWKWKKFTSVFPLEFWKHSNLLTIQDVLYLMSFNAELKKYLFANYKSTHDTDILLAIEIMQTPMMMVLLKGHNFGPCSNPQYHRTSSSRGHAKANLNKY